MHQDYRTDSWITRQGLWLVCVVCFLAACESPPEIQVAFPPQSSQFSGDALSIRGSINASTENPVTVQVASDSGTLDAAIDVPLGSWSVSDFTLGEGLQTLTVTASSAAASADTSLALTVDTSLNTLRVTSLIELSGEVYVSDARLRSIVHVDSDTGVRKIISGAERGTGPALEVPAYLGTDGTDLFLLDQGLAALLRIDVATGDRLIVSGQGRGSGVDLSQPRVFTVTGDKFLVADHALDALVLIESDTGNRNIVYRDFIDGDPVILSPRGITVNAAGEVYVADEQYAAVLRIDLDSGLVEIASGGDVGEGPEIGTPRDLKLLSSGNLVMLDGADKTVVEIDTLTGDRTSLVSEIFEIPVALALGDAGPLVADNSNGAVWQVFDSGADAGVLSQVGIGEGPRLASPDDLLPVTGGWLVADSATGSLIFIDNSGNRQVELTDLGEPVDLLRDSVTGLIYILNAEFNRWSVIVYDRNAGTTRALSGPSVGSGPLLLDPRHLVFHADELLVLETVTSRILSVDPATGDRTVFVNEESGEGVSLAGSTRFTLADGRGALFLLDIVRSRILQLDLETGVQNEIVSGTRWRDITYDTNADRIVILAEEALFSFDLVTQSLSTLSGAGNHLGDYPAVPVAVEIVAEDLATVVDAGLDAVFVIDLKSGNRVMASR